MATNAVGLFATRQAVLRSARVARASAAPALVVAAVAVRHPLSRDGATTHLNCSHHIIPYAAFRLTQGRSRAGRRSAPGRRPSRRAAPKGGAISLNDAPRAEICTLTLHDALPIL